MIKIPARHTADLLKYLLERERDFKEKSDANADAIISSEDSRWLLENIRPILDYCEELGMEHPKDEILERVKNVHDRLKIPETEFSVSEQGYTRLYHDIRQIRKSVEYYLDKISLFRIPADHVLYYEQEDLFGVKDKFPKANEEIKSAGNCYATGNYTACVFHLMRSAEIGVKEMYWQMTGRKNLVYGKDKTTGKPLSKPIELCDWKTLIIGLTLALDKLEIGKSKSKVKHKKHSFYTETVGIFKHLKDGWRNTISHAHEVNQEEERKLFLPGETKDIMRDTERFMQRIATKVKA